MANIDHVAALELLRDEGAISDQEFEDLKDEILTPDDALSDEPSLDVPAVMPTWEAILDWRPTLRADVPPKYPGALLVIAGLFVVFSMFGVVSWFVSFLAVLAMTATLVEGGFKVTVGSGLALGLIILLEILGAAPNTTVDSASADTDSVPAATEIVSGSLGLGLADLSEQWNSLEEQPAITRGLTVNSESGQYDSFIYRFGDWGRLAGAYDPSTDALYGLLVAGQLSNEATSQLYLHLCFVLHPYSQGCIDSYFEEGLDNLDLADFGDRSHSAQWEIENQTWALEIEDNVLTIRALAADAS